MAEIWGLALAAAGGSIIGGAISAGGAESAASTAANANAANTASTNAANLNLFNLSRGAVNPATGYGSSVLPTYFGAGEQNMANDAMNQFNTISGQANNVYAQQQGALNNMMPALNSSMTALGNLYNGQNLQQQLGYQAPLYAANTGYAQTQARGLGNVAQANSNAIGTSLASTLAGMNAQNNNQGFLGSSTFNNNRLLQATIPAQQQAAVGQASAQAQGQNLMSQANLSNVGTTAGLQMQNLAQMANPGTLASGIGAYGSALSSPLQQLSNSYQSAQAPLNFFRIGNQAWQQQNMPTVYPQINGAQIAGGAVSTLGSSINQYGQQQQQNALMQQLLGGAQNLPSTNQFANYFSPTSPYGSSNSSSLFNMNTSLLGNNSFGTADPYSAAATQPFTSDPNAFAGLSG